MKIFLLAETEQTTDLSVRVDKAAWVLRVAAQHAAYLASSITHGCAERCNASFVLVWRVDWDEPHMVPERAIYLEAAYAVFSVLLRLQWRSRLTPVWRLDQHCISFVTNAV